jgi:hypothetical protein
MAGNVISSIGSNALSQSYWSGISNAIQAIQDPVRYGASYIKQLATSAVPLSGLARAATQYTDPITRAPNGIVQAVEANVPGLSQNVPAKLDAFGNTIPRAGIGGLPWKTSTATNSPVEAELTRLNVTPSVVGNTANGVPLTPAEQQMYQQKAGAYEQQNLTDLIASSDYQQSSDADRIVMLDHVITAAHKRGAADVLDGISPDQQIQRKQQKTSAPSPAAPLPAFTAPQYVGAP